MMINNIKLTGSGISTIFNINTTNAGVRLYRITNADISHIKFVATSTSNSNCFVADETDRIKIENCWFYDFEHTIIIQSGKYHMITNNYIIMPQLSNIISIDFIGGSYSLINNNVIDTPTSNSWGVSISSDNNVVNGNIIRGMNKSIKVNGDYNIITNNHTDDCAIDNTGTNNVIENNF